MSVFVLPLVQVILYNLHIPLLFECVLVFHGNNKTAYIYEKIIDKYIIGIFFFSISCFINSGGSCECGSGECVWPGLQRLHLCMDLLPAQSQQDQ